jgi:microcystin-dependent protein
MSLNIIEANMTSGLLQEANNLSEFNNNTKRKNSMVNLGLESAIPVGVVLPYAGTSPPSGWLFCTGQILPINATYQDLYDAIGTFFGGDGFSTFGLPDLRGRVVAGRDLNVGAGMASRLSTTHFGADGQNVGQTGGTEAHTLTTAQIPAHSHFVANTDATTSVTPLLTASQYMALSNDTGGRGAYEFNGTATLPTVGKSSDVGSGNSHSSLQPTMILNYIIKAYFGGEKP